MPFAGNPNTFQIKLFEGSDVIEFHYDDISNDGDGSPAWVGVQNQKGDVTTEILALTGGATDVGGTDLDGHVIRLRADGTTVPASRDYSSAISGADQFDLETVDFDDYDIIYVPTVNQDFDDTSGPSGHDLDTLALRQADLTAFVRKGGGIVAFTEQRTEAVTGAYGWLAIPDLFQSQPLPGGTYNEMAITNAAFNAGLTQRPPSDPSIGYHLEFLGPAGFNGLDPFLINRGNNGSFDSVGVNCEDNMGNPIACTDAGGDPMFTQINPDDRIIAIGQGAINESVGGGQTTEINDGGTGQFATLRIGLKATSLTVNALGGNDTITVGDPSDALEDILSPLIINGAVDPNTETDSLSVTDEGDTNPNAVLVDNDSVDGLAGFAVTFAGIDDLTVTSAQGDDTFDLDVTTPLDLDSVTLNGAAGNDTFGAAGDMVEPSLTVAITINGGSPVVGDAGVPPGDTLYLDMSAATAPVIVDTVGGVAQSASHQTLNFSSIESFDVDDASGDIIPRDMPGTDAGGDLYVRGTDSSDPQTNGNDRIVFSYAGSGRVRTFVNDVFQGNFIPTRTIVVRGRDGNDQVIGAYNVDLSMEFHGEEGNDDLQSSSENDLMFGGDGDDRLLSGDGDDQEPLLERQALHAARLVISHPTSGEPIDFAAPLPEDLQTVVSALQEFRAL